MTDRAELVRRLFDYCHKELGLGPPEAPADAAEALRRGVATPLGKSARWWPCAAPPRSPRGWSAAWRLRRTGDVLQRVWTELLLDTRWEPYDPENGFTRELPYNYLPARATGSSWCTRRACRTAS